MKSILTFSKWTKINVQKWVVQKVLTEKIFYYDIENLSSQIKLKPFILLLKKNLKIFSQRI
jgi:hypothetical protein